MEHPNPKRLADRRSARVMAPRDGRWPFSRRAPRGAASPELERATLGVLAATARAWGLAAPAAARQAG
jgi:hypothetical protein